MKNLFTNLFVFITLCVALSNFTACSKTANNAQNSVVETNAANSTTAPETTKSGDFPPVPSALYQAEIKDLDGKTYKLEDKKGKIVLVNFWALWCGPCVAEMPALSELNEKYKDKNFEVLGLNTGDSETGEPEPADKIRAFLQEKKISYPVAYADEKFFSEMVRLTRMAAIPQSLLINRDGKMIGIFKGGGPRIVNDINQAVEKAVSE